MHCLLRWQTERPHRSARRFHRFPRSARWFEPLARSAAFAGIVTLWAPCAIAGELLAAHSLVTPLWREPGAVACGDLDGDGSLDVVVPDQSAGAVTVFLGDGAGRWRSRFDYATLGGPSAAALGDLNGDDVLDLVTGHSRWEGGLSVFLGHGDGSFAPEDTVTVPSIRNSVLLGDLDEDGAVDVVGDGFIVLHGRGDGSFAPPRLLDKPRSAGSAVLTDLDGDAHLDLAYCRALNVGGAVTIRWGDGRGGFRSDEEILLPIAGGPTACGELNGDGSPDLAVGLGPQGIVVLVSTGGGRFAPPSPVGERGGYPTALVCADFDADGRDDLAAALGSSPSVALLRGRGDGTLAAAGRFRVGSGPHSLVTGDFNRDGHLDLAAANRASYTLAILPGHGDCSFGGGHEAATTTEPLALALGDLDHDGALDVVTAGRSGSLSVLFGNRDGTVRERTDYALGGYLSDVAIADLDGDSWPEVAVTDKAANELAILRGGEGGLLAPPARYATGQAPAGCVFVDLNLDGRLDVVVANEQSNALSVRLGSGGASFGAPRGYATAAYATAIVAGNLDGDPYPDVAVACEVGSGTGGVSVHRGNPDGSLSTIYEAATGPMAYGLALGDLDGDGTTDLVTTSAAYGALYRFLGSGNGAFTPLPALACGPSPWSALIADLDGDRLADVAVSLYQAHAVSILRGQGGGELVPFVASGCGPNPVAIAAGDLNGDGYPDLTTANFSGRSVSILLNRTAITSVLLSGVEVSLSGARIVLSWQLATEGANALAAVHVQRSDTPSGPWVDLTPGGMPPRPRMTFEDSLPSDGRETWYRIEIRLRSGAVVTSAPILAQPASGLRPRSVLYPPIVTASGGALIRCRLAPHGARPDLSIYDVRGRILWSQRLAPQAGEQAVHWDRRALDGVVAARGIYVVRLQDGHVVATRKLALFH